MKPTIFEVFLIHTNQRNENFNLLIADILKNSKLEGNGSYLLDSMTSLEDLWTNIADILFNHTAQFEGEFNTLIAYILRKKNNAIIVVDRTISTDDQKLPLPF